MNIQDVLIGENSVIIKQEKENVELEKIDDSTVKGDIEHLEDSVVSALKEKGFTFESRFPIDITIYVNDSATSYDKERVAEKIGLNKGNTTVEKVANIGYEIPITVQFKDADTWEVTEVFGKPLEEPFSF